MWQSVIISKDGEFYALVMGCCNDIACLTYHDRKLEMKHQDEVSVVE